MHLHSADIDTTNDNNRRVKEKTTESAVPMRKIRKITHIDNCLVTSQVGHGINISLLEWQLLRLFFSS